MKVLAKYGYDIDEQSYVCELSFDEIALVSSPGDALKAGSELDVIDLHDKARGLQAAMQRIAAVDRLAVRAETLLQSLTREIEQARLTVHYGDMPPLGVLRAFTDHLKTLTETI